MTRKTEGERRKRVRAKVRERKERPQLYPDPPPDGVAAFWLVIAAVAVAAALLGWLLL